MIIPLFAFLAFATSCQEQTYELGELTQPTELKLTVAEVDPGTGRVSVNYGAKNAITHKVVFSANTSPSSGKFVSSENNGTFTEKFSKTGEYEVIYYAYGTGGKYDSLVTKVNVIVNYVVPTNITSKLTNGTSKLWKWDKNNKGHLGVGPVTKDYPEWYTAGANEKPDCLYNDELTFTLNPNGSISYTSDNKGDTFIHVDHQSNLKQTPAGSDACYAFTTGSTEVSFSEAGTGITNSTGVAMSLGKEFLSFALETNTYEILSITDTELYVRTVETAPDGSKRAWYQRFVSASSNNCVSGLTGNTAGTGTYQLVWADEFNTNGAPCSNNWTYDLGRGDNGWGNNEAQYYTNRPENVKVTDGSLNITLRKEAYGNAQYTSARLKTQDLFEFKYGKVEVRAKLPQGGGVWPAIWMLGANIDQVGWPASGEIDIMEHKGNEPTKIYGTVHTPAGSGGNATGGVTNIANASDWHLYTAEWTSTEIKFYVDNNLFFTYNPAQNANTWPFNHDFFIILNVAMGGTFGGAIDPAFVQSAMEVDYVRVYQK